VFIPEIFTTKEDALALAQNYHLDLVVLGEVPYYLDGGTVGISGLQVDLKVLDARDGRMVWNLSDSIKATPRPIIDLKATPRPIIDLWVTETRPYPTPPMGSLAAQLAARMATTLEKGAPTSSSSGLAALLPMFNGN